MKTYLNTLFVLFVLLCISSACNKETTAPVSKNIEKGLPEFFKEGFFVLNEGNFGWGLATIDFYSLKEQKMYNDVFAKANPKGLLGNVLQSMAADNDYFYLVVNNSQKIEVLSKQNFEVKKTIRGFNSPRYLAFDKSILPKKAYVTELYSNIIQEFNLSSNTITNRINTNARTEKIVAHQGVLLVACGDLDSKKGQLLVLDPQLSQITKSIPLSSMPQDIIMDGSNKIWLLLGGNKEEKAALVCLNNDYEQEKQMDFASLEDKPRKLCYDAEKKLFYYLNKNSVFRVEAEASALPTKPLIQNIGRLIYGMALAPNGETLYLTDAIDYLQKGKIFFMNAGTGQQQAVYETGVIPNEIFFVQ